MKVENETKKRADVECQSSSFLPFYAMHEVTPSAVAMADSILMAVWIANFQNVLFFMVIMF